MKVLGILPLKVTADRPLFIPPVVPQEDEYDVILKRQLLPDVLDYLSDRLIDVVSVEEAMVNLLVDFLFGCGVAGDHPDQGEGAGTGPRQAELLLVHTL